MRILFLSPNLPVPVNSGQAMRTLSMVQALARNHDVTFFCFGNLDPATSLEPLSTRCRRLEIVPKPFKTVTQGGDYTGRLASLLAFRSYGVHRFHSQEMRRLVDSALRNEAPDVIVADGGVYVLTNVPETTIPIVINTHNVEWMILRRFGELEKNPIRKAYAYFESSRMRSAESVSCGLAKLALACSDNDRQLLHELAPELPVFVVPNCIDTDAYSASVSERDAHAPVLLFQGGMDWLPNRDAVDYFAGSIFPAIRRRYPEAKFVVAGKNPSPEFVRKFAELEGIEFTGTIPDMRPYLEAATLVIVPLRMGSGTRLKILEAAAAGRAAVSTSIGAEGLEFIPEEEIVIADGEGVFADRICDLLADRNRRTAIEAAARQKVIARYSFPVLQETLDAALATLARTQVPAVVK